MQQYMQAKAKNTVSEAKLVNSVGMFAMFSMHFRVDVKQRRSEHMQALFRSWAVVAKLFKTGAALKRVVRSDAKKRREHLEQVIVQEWHFRNSAVCWKLARA